MDLTAAGWRGDDDRILRSFCAKKTAQNFKKKKEKKENVNYLRTTAQLCCHFGRKLGQIITPKFAS